MFCVKFAILQQRIIYMHSCLFVYPLRLRCSLHFFFEIKIVVIVTKEKEHALRRLYRTHARARVMSEIEEVQEQMMVNMETMKEKMTKMMEIT